jgi:hypothetical protein
MGQGVGEVLTFAVGVAISPVPIIAVVLMLFSGRARVNGPLFLLGWVVALVVVAGAVYAVADAGDVGTDTGASDTVSWGKVVAGGLFLLFAARQWRTRPEGGAEAAVPRWMASIDTLAPAKALALGVLLAGVNPKNLLLTAGAAAGLAQLDVSTTAAVVSLCVFVALASITIAGPVVYYLLGGATAKARLDDLKGWLAVHNAAVMTVLFLVLGVNLIAKGLGLLSS